MSEATDPRYAQLTTIGPRKRLTGVPAGVSRKSVDPTPTKTKEHATEHPELDRTSSMENVDTHASGTPMNLAVGERQRSRAPQPKSAKAARPPVSESATKLERVPCRVGADLHARLNAKATETGLSQTGVALRAIEAAHTAGVFTFAAPATGMFIGAAGRRRGPATAKVMLDLRPRTEDLATIEELMEQHQAPDRTAFIVAALDHFLA